MAKWFARAVLISLLAAIVFALRITNDKFTDSALFALLVMASLMAIIIFLGFTISWLIAKAFPDSRFAKEWWRSR